jgi:hypothetical protein
MAVLDVDKVDVVDIVGLLLMAVPIAAYCLIVRRQHRMLKKHTARVQILSTRTALFLPTYAIFMYLCLIMPGIAAGMEVPIAIAEGILLILFVLFAEYSRVVDANTCSIVVQLAPFTAFLPC